MDSNNGYKWIGDENIEEEHRYDYRWIKDKKKREEWFNKNWGIF